MNISDIRGSKTNGEYYYIRNAQGDIIGLADITGTQVVTYNYDTWGKLISIEGNQTVGLKNPYRYRGYRYDTETGLYYLNARYYNPEWGRFINADALCGKVGTLLSHNVFTYCLNNPINMEDPSGYIAWWIIGAGVGAIAGGIAGAIISKKKTGTVNWKYVAAGAVAGGLVGAGLGYIAPNVYNYISGIGGAATAAAENAAKGGQDAARNAANAAKLNAQLTYQEASSVFTNSGLHPDVVKNSKQLIPGANLGNKTVIQALTADGSSINSWAKMSTQTFRSPSGNFQVHFYQNLETEVVSIFEMKVKFNK